MSVKNEAAERLLLLWTPSWPEGKAAFEMRVNDALAAERRATVERIVPGWVKAQYRDIHSVSACKVDATGCRCPCHGDWGKALAILDEEAAR